MENSPFLGSVLRRSQPGVKPRSLSGFGEIVRNRYLSLLR